MENDRYSKIFGGLNFVYGSAHFRRLGLHAAASSETTVQSQRTSYVGLLNMASETTATFSWTSNIRGYHVYQEIWVASEGEVLSCMREVGNIQDPFAVAIKKSSTTVGHVPRKVSAVCSMFLRRGGSIMCQVIGMRRYSRDLPQGGLEVPCILTFSGESKLVDKVELLLKEITIETVKEHDKSNELKSKDNSESKSPDCKRSKPDYWIVMDGMILTSIDKEAIVNGLELNDMHVSFSQKLLGNQFPSIVGLRSPLVPVTEIGCWIANYLQIFHC